MLPVKLTSFTIAFFVLPCSMNTNTTDYPALSPIEEYQLSVAEPSGMAFGKSYRSLWIVSDVINAYIFQTNLQGVIIKALPFQGDDVEGISYYQRDDALWIVEEQKKEIVKLALNGNILLRKKIDFSPESKHGFEGISIQNDGRLWLTHEKTPGLLLMSDQNFTITG